MRVLFSLLSCFAYINYSSACEPSKDIKKVDNGYLYTNECHIWVGKKIQELDLRINQVNELNKAIELKDLALRKTEERVGIWMDTAFKANDRLNQYESIKSRNEWLHFGLGVLTTSLAVWGASRLVR